MIEMLYALQELVRLNHQMILRLVACRLLLSALPLLEGVCGDHAHFLHAVEGVVQAVCLVIGSALLCKPGWFQRPKALVD